MAETTGISWARSTANPWIGCTEVGPGCDHCYARESYIAKVKNIRWGAGKPRHRVAESTLKHLTTWNKKALEERRTGVRNPKDTWKGPMGFWPVFIASLADVFDNEALDAWRVDLWKRIEACPYLTFYIVTKRVGNVEKMVPERWMREGFPANVRIIVTVVNQQEADRDIPKLLALPCHNGVSYEPALEGIDWRPFVSMDQRYVMARRIANGGYYPRRLEWGIVGGESKQGGFNPRAFDIGWARQMVQQFRENGTPRFVKQMGDNTYGRNAAGVLDRIKFRAPAGADPAEWPEDLRIQEHPIAANLPDNMDAFA